MICILMIDHVIAPHAEACLGKSADARFYSETKGLDEMFGEHEWPRPLQQKMSLEARNESISKIKANWNEKQLVMQVKCLL